MVELKFMKNFFKITTILFVLSLLASNTFADEIIDKSKKVINILTKKSLTKDEILNFLSEYVIIIDDERGDGIVTYYFEDHIYKIYKNLNLISEDKWMISKFDKKLKLFNYKNKITWKIHLGKKNMINIKKKRTLIGELYKFSYESKTEYHVSLEEKKIKKQRNN